MPRKRPKPKSLAYKVKWLAFRYVTRAVSGEGFKRELRAILDEFARQDSLLQQNVSVSLCKWLMEYERLADPDKYAVDIRKACELANEVEPRVGEHLERWKEGWLKRYTELIRERRRLKNDAGMGKEMGSR